MSSLDDAIVAGVRSGDEAVFAELLNDWSRSMLLLARSFVSTDATAEEVVQDTWLAVIRGIDRFEGRSSLRTWVYRILVNIAKKRGTRESRTLPWSSVGLDPSVRWLSCTPQCRSAEGMVLDGEVRTQVVAAMRDLPARQRLVITLRDVMGHDSEEVCHMLEITAVNQRVLLHRARAGVRTHLAPYLAPAPGSRGDAACRGPT